MGTHSYSSGAYTIPELWCTGFREYISGKNVTLGIIYSNDTTAEYTITRQFSKFYVTFHWKHILIGGYKLIFQTIL